MYECMYVYIYISIYLNISIYLYIYLYNVIYVYVDIHTHAYTYVHAQVVAKHCLGTTHIMCFARTSLREHISDVHHAHVITGFGRVVANKAGAAVGPIACTLSGGRAYSMHSKRACHHRLWPRRRQQGRRGCPMCMHA